MKYIPIIPLAFAGFAFFGCSDYISTNVEHYKDEKKFEVSFDDIMQPTFSNSEADQKYNRGLHFALKCVIHDNGRECGAVFDRFGSTGTRHSHYYDDYDEEHRTITIAEPSFTNGSILSMQVREAHSKEWKPLIAYFQNDSIYTKGNEFIPSTMNRLNHDSTEYIRLSGYYSEKNWIKKDTTIKIGQVITPDDQGILKFYVRDYTGETDSISIDISSLLKIVPENFFDFKYDSRVNDYRITSALNSQCEVPYKIASTLTITKKQAQFCSKGLKQSPLFRITDYPEEMIPSESRIIRLPEYSGDDTYIQVVYNAY